MSEAIFRQNAGQQDYTPGSASLAGAVSQLSDGRAAVTKADLAASEKGAVYTLGIFDFLSASAVTFAAGEEVWWDASADTAIARASAESGDFPVGKAVAAKASGDLVVRVDLNTHGFNGLVRHFGKVIGPTTLTPTAAVTLTASGHGGKTIICNSLCRKVTLPLATVGIGGVEFTVVAGAVVGSASLELWVDPVSADKVNGGTSGIGLRLQQTADVLGDHLTLVCDGTGWWTKSRFGTWAAASAA